MNVKLNKKSRGPKLFMFFLIFVGLAFSLGMILMLLWNTLMPKIFGVSEITYFQGVGLLILSKLLLGGVSMKSGGNQSISQAQMKSAFKEALTEAKQADSPYDDTDEADQVYEQWWQDEGEAYFDKYMNTLKNEEA